MDAVTGYPHDVDSAAEVMDDPLIGRTVAGKYLIQSRVGGGAMGVVYEARQIALDRRVAIKVLNRELQTRLQFVGRFQVEAKAASLLDHANVTRVLDFGTDDTGLLYICMEFLEGQNLFELVRNEWPIDASRVANIMSQTLAALAKAHDMGILHRDIKPDNIVLQRRVDDEGNESDVVKVCDFGIAKLEGVEVFGLSTVNGVGDSYRPAPMDRGGPALTSVGLIIGTPDYMSPEQARGETLDPRSDIYSVGVVLYHLLAGRPPFDGDDAAEILTKHITDEPVPPSAIAKVDAELEEICAKAMSKSPDHRYRTAREMRAALRRSAVFARTGTELTGPISTMPSSHSSIPDSGEVGRSSVMMPPAAPLPTMRGRRTGTIALVVGVLLALGGTALALRSHQKTAKTEGNGPPDAGVMALVDPHAAGAGSANPGDPANGASVTAFTRPTATDPASGGPGAATAPAVLPTGAKTAMAPVPPPTSTGAPPTNPIASAAAATGATTANTAPPTPAPPPVDTTPPPPVVAVTAASPSPPAAVPAPPPFHPENGRVEIAKVETDRVTSRAINEVLRHANLQRCYVDALTKAGSAKEGTAVLSLEIDQNRVEHARLGDTLGLSGLGTCIEGQFSHARVAEADTGDATATITLHFVDP